MKMLCIDGHSIMNRAYYGAKGLMTSDGRHSGAIYGFTNILMREVIQYDPDAVVVAYDTPIKTFRHEMFDGYKAGRKPMDPEFAAQIPVIKELVEMMGYTGLELAGYEADDILGTLARICKENNWECLIATGDQDSLQLIDEHTKILYHTAKKNSKKIIFDLEYINTTYMLTPNQLIDLKALQGDSSDKLPGVPGVGPVVALPLIQKFGNIEVLYESLDDESISKGVRNRLIAGRDLAFLCKQLVTIELKVPIEQNPKSYLKKRVNLAGVIEILSSYEMNSLLSRLNDLPVVIEETNPTDESDEYALEVIEPVEMTIDTISSGEIYLLLVGGSIYASKGVNFYRLSREVAKAVLEDARIDKYCFDIKNLWHYCYNWNIKIQNLKFDAQLAAYLLNPSSSDYTLNILSLLYKVKPLFTSITRPEMGKLQPLTELLKQQLEQKGMSELLGDIEMPLAAVLAQMERTGFLVDRLGLADYGAVLSVELEHVRGEIYDMVGREFNVNSSRQLAEALFVDLALPPGKKIKTGYSTNVDVLRNLIGVHPVIERILEYRRYQKLITTYVNGLLSAAAGDSRIHTEFKQLETRTGRISSSNPNLQNIPARTELGAKIRQYFIAPEGKILLDADYSQIELRVLASLSGDRNMIEAFNEGHDIHTETACQVFGLTRDMITPELRRRAKAVNFGIVYGIGAYSLAEDLAIPIWEAQQYIDNYLMKYSGVREYLDQVVAEAKSKGYVSTTFGRQRLIPELNHSNRNTAALGRRLAMNTPIQGTAADIIKIAMVKVQNRFKAEGLSANLILQVHDELIVEVLVEEKEQAKQILTEEMANAVPLDVELVVDVGEGSNWYDAK